MYCLFLNEGIIKSDVFSARKQFLQKCGFSCLSGSGNKYSLEVLFGFLDIRCYAAFNVDHKQLPFDQSWIWFRIRQNTAAKKCLVPWTHVPSPAEGLLRVEFGEGMMIIPQHLRRQIYGSTRTLTILVPECIFPVYLYYRSGCSSAGIFLADV